MTRVPLGRAWPLVVLVWSATAFAHEHMYIGSDRAGGGTLVLRYDFTRDFPLVPQPGTGTYIGTDPAFNAQVVDDPAAGIYRLKGGTTLRMEITALDPDVTVTFNGKKLAAPGAQQRIGRMPYLHQHPQWTLTAPVGTTGTYHLSFRVRAAAGYAPSASYTATLAPTVPETTTTLPGPANCTPAECQDTEPCTIDTCQADGCHHDVATGADAVRCRLAKLQAEMDDVRPSTPAGRRIVERLFAIVNVVESALSDTAAGGPRVQRSLRRAQARMNRFSSVVDRGVGKHVIATDDGEALRTLAGDVYDQLVQLSL